MLTREIVKEVLLTMIIVCAHGVIQRCGHFPHQGQFLLSEDIDYLLPNATAQVGHLVIVPGLRFSCHGYITGWSALVQFSSNEAAIDNLFHDINFQVWRPVVIDNEILYNFVGSQTIDFIGRSLRNNLIVDSGTQYLNFTSARPRNSDPEEMLVFQPGDVVGWYIHRLVQSIEIPLTIAYRSSFNSSGSTYEQNGLLPVDMYSTLITDTKRGDTEPPCELSLQTNQTRLISSIIPYITVDYVYVPVKDRMCISPFSEDIIQPSKSVLVSTTTVPVYGSPNSHSIGVKQSATSDGSENGTTAISTCTTTSQISPPSTSRSSSGIDGLSGGLLGLVVILIVIIFVMAIVIAYLLVILKKQKLGHVPIPLDKF